MDNNLLVIQFEITFVGKSSVYKKRTESIIVYFYYTLSNKKYGDLLVK
jgi:hypothetical protein